MSSCYPRRKKGSSSKPIETTTDLVDVPGTRAPARQAVRSGISPGLGTLTLIWPELLWHSSQPRQENHDLLSKTPGYSGVGVDDGTRSAAASPRCAECGDPRGVGLTGHGTPG